MISLLAGKDPDAWVYLNQVYRPSMRGWLAGYGVRPDDAEDLIQDVQLLITQKIESFEHNGRRGAFRAWLKAMTINGARNFLRSSAVSKKSGMSVFEEALEGLSDPQSSFTRAFDIAHDHAVIKVLLHRVARQVEEDTLALFVHNVLDENPPNETAAHFKVNVGKVYVAKSRVLRKLRTLNSEWVDELQLER
ncbi:MAG: sigma-70 family RNA polymerase sigma factor [Candidatus Sedimenticola sp. (ex Thyasira tokunagai)]